jgi:hypothetical protein
MRRLRGTTDWPKLWDQLDWEIDPSCMTDEELPPCSCIGNVLRTNWIAANQQMWDAFREVHRHLLMEARSPSEDLLVRSYRLPLQGLEPAHAIVVSIDLSRRWISSWTRLSGHTPVCAIIFCTVGLYTWTQSWPANLSYEGNSVVGKEQHIGMTSMEDQGKRRELEMHR